MPPLDDLTGDFFTPTREEIVRQYQRDYVFRQADARIGDGSVPYVRGNVLADTLLPVYADALAIANDIGLEDKSSAGLDLELSRIGAPPRFAEVGGSGYVTITASAGGGTILAGDEIKDPQTGLRFQCTVTDRYYDAGQVPVAGIDTGTQTNLAAATVMSWTTPRAGIGTRATVAATPTGAGLTGGRPAESDPEVITRIKAAKADPPAAGNDAQIQKFVAATPGVPVQQVFTYPAADGPGTTAYAFTLAPATVGATRAPSAVQIAATRAYVVGQCPKDDGIIDCLVVEVGVDLMLKVKWLPGAAGWKDVVTWPPYVGGGVTSGTVVTVVDASTFSVECATAPQVGTTFGFFDASSGTFKKKRVLTAVVAGANIDLTIDNSNSGSDSTFLPVVGMIPCPWSDSLDTLVLPVRESFEGLGPGEMFDPFFDPGFRQKRNPESPATWSSELGSRAFRALDDIEGVTSVQIMYPTIPYATPVGTPNVSVKLLVLGKLSAFPA